MNSEDIDVINTFWDEIAFAIVDNIDGDFKAGEVTNDKILDIISLVADDVAATTLGYDNVTLEDMNTKVFDGMATEEEVDNFMKQTEIDRAAELYDIFKDNIDYITEKYNEYLKSWEDTMTNIFGKNI